MKQYLDLVRDVLENGEKIDDRTGVGTLSVFGRQMRFDLNEGFPLVTTKKVHFKSIVHELIWFLKGDTNVKYLQDNGVTIWDEWADRNGNLGPVYGKQWRDWQGVDQIRDVIDQIKKNPTSRRLVVSAWNLVDVPKMALPPCHCLFQFNVQNGRLSCQLYQRSADCGLGVPYNIASYALLTHMIAHVTNLNVGEFIHTLGDAHIYLNHVDTLKIQLQRESHPLPKLKLNESVKSIDDFKYSDIELIDYVSHSALRMDVAV